MARKSCNYVTAAVEECGNELIGDCYSEEEVTRKKDAQLDGKLEQLSESISEWDSDKCPVIKAHLVRTNKAPVIAKDATEKKEVTEDSADRAKLENDTLDAGSATKEDETLKEDKTSPLGVATEEVVHTVDSTDTGEEDDTGHTSTEEPDSGSKAVAATLSIVIVLYMTFSS